MIDAYLQEQQATFEALKEKLRRTHPHMSQRIAEIKQQRQETQA
jgi:hypothetical protein